MPLAAVLWNGGISFGGVISFIFADLIIIPILVIYRKYYGDPDDAGVLLGLFYATMVLAGYLVELIFGALGLVPPPGAAKVAEAQHQLELHDGPQHRVPAWPPLRCWRGSSRSGGRPMLRMMGGGPDDAGAPAHDHHAHGVTDL